MLINLLQNLTQIWRLGGLSAGRCVFMVRKAEQIRVMGSVVIAHNESAIGALLVVTVVNLLNIIVTESELLLKL